MASATVERAQWGGLGNCLVARKAKPAPSIVEGPQQRLEHGEGLGGDDAIRPALNEQIVRRPYHGSGGLGSPRLVCDFQPMQAPDTVTGDDKVRARRGNHLSATAPPPRGAN
jgi:hypothetical protein